MPYAASLIDWFALLVLTAALVAAALSDATSLLIPNRYPAAIALAFCLYAIGKPLAFSLHGIAVGAVMLIGGAFLFARGVIGGGDVKLLAATSLWAGFDHIAFLLVTSAIAGGVLALAQLSPLGRLMPVRTASGAVANDFRSKMHMPMPFGLAISFGGICVALARLVS